MRKLLTIGEVTRLVGVTPKTVRHYHRIGLLPEPTRSEGGYRLYGAEDLLRLKRVRRLSELGLSLKQIGAVLGEHGGGHSLRDVLKALLGEIEAEIEKLEERRERVRDLLSREEIEVSAREPGEPGGIRLVKEYLGEHLSGGSPELWQQEKRLLSVIEAFDWPGGYREAEEAMARYYAEHPEVYRGLVSLGERLVALMHESEGSPEVDRLAEDMARFFEENPEPTRLPIQPDWSEGPLGHAMAGLIATELSPAQMRCIELIDEALEGAESKGDRDDETRA